MAERRDQMPLDEDAAAPAMGDEPRPGAARGPLAARLRQLGKETTLYGGLTAISSIAAVLVTPLLTRALTPAQYGIVATLTTLVVLATALATLGMDSAAARWLYEEESVSWRRLVLSTWFWLQFPLSLAIGIVIALLAPLLAEGIFGSSEATGPLRCVAIVVPLSASVTIAGNWLRLERRPVMASLFLGCNTLLTVILPALLVILFGFGVLGFFGGLIMAALIMTPPALLVIGRAISPAKANLTELRGMLAYGLPLVPAALAVWVTTFSDRILVAAISGSEAAGIYAIAATVTMALGLLTAAFRLAWAPFAFSILAEPDSGKVLASVMSWMVWVASTLAALVSVLAPLGVRILAPDEFQSAAEAVPFLAFAEVALILTTVFAIGANIAKSNIPVAIALITSGVVNIGLNLMLIPSMGFEGAAIATLVAAALGAFIMYVTSQRLHRIDYRLVHLTQAVFLAVALTSAAQMVPADDASGLALRVLIITPMVLLPLLNGMIRQRDDSTDVRSSRG